MCCVCSQVLISDWIASRPSPGISPETGIYTLLLSFRGAPNSLRRPFWTLYYTPRPKNLFFFFCIFIFLFPPYSFGSVAKSERRPSDIVASGAVTRLERNCLTCVVSNIISTTRLHTQLSTKVNGAGERKEKHSETCAVRSNPQKFN